MRGRWAPPPAEGEGPRKAGKGKWQEANRRRPLQTATQPGAMPTPPPPPPCVVCLVLCSCVLLSGFLIVFF